jgi:hypothetical protein
MTKKLLLVLPDDVHSTLTELQIDCNHVTRTRSSLNQVLVELVQAGKSHVPVNEIATGILKRAAAKNKAKSN